MFADLGHFSYAAIQVNINPLLSFDLIVMSYLFTLVQSWQLRNLTFVLPQTAFTFLVYPALILAYMGQAAYLSQHHHTSYQISFYVSVPGIPDHLFSKPRKNCRKLTDEIGTCKFQV